MNARPDVFDLGFAWGGLPGVAPNDLGTYWGDTHVGRYKQDHLIWQWRGAKRAQGAAR